MAAVAASAVTLIAAYENGDKQGKTVGKVRIVDIVLSSQGGTTLDIPASLFGMTRIDYAYCVRAIVSSALAWIQVVTEVSGVGILTCDPTVATDASRGTPANISGTIRVVVTGI